jgi:hypothetical protein
LNGWSVVEVWYLGLDHVDMDCGPWLSWEAISPMDSYPCLGVEGLLKSKDKYNSLIIVCFVCCIQVIMLLELFLYTYIYIAYMLALPASMIVHNVFHISLLKEYIPDDNHVIYWNVIQVEQ